MINYQNTSKEIVFVISDLHSNKNAINAAIKSIKKTQYDQLIILGDLLTYGIDVQEVIDIVNEATENGALLLLGNHDQMYLDLISGHCEIFNTLQQYIKESIIYNFDRLDIKQFASLPWEKEIIHNNIYYSHANPYGNVYDYIKSDIDFENASKKINSMGYVGGVFGHTHRNKYFTYRPNNSLNDIFILNPGSVGQPRMKPPVSTMLKLSYDKNNLLYEISPVIYDVKGHIESLKNSSLSDATKLKLISFFKE